MASNQNWGDTKKSLVACAHCKQDLPCGPRPIFKISPTARILIISQAPGLKAHESGIPWYDPSGRRLIEWLGVSSELFYDSDVFATMPMGMCYPGRSKSGDLPPMKACAPLWHQQLIPHMPNIQLKLLIGQYSQKYYLDGHMGSLTENVKHWQKFLPEYFVLPHPSPRNQVWTRKHPWFESEVLAGLRIQVRCILN